MSELIAAIAAISASGLLSAARDDASFVPKRPGLIAVLVGYACSTIAAWCGQLDPHAWWVLPLSVFTASSVLLALVRPLVVSRWLDAASCTGFALVSVATFALLIGGLGGA